MVSSIALWQDGLCHSYDDKRLQECVIHWTNDGKTLFPTSRVSSVLVNRMWLLTCIGRGYTNERVEHIWIVQVISLQKLIRRISDATITSLVRYSKTPVIVDKWITVFYENTTKIAGAIQVTLLMSCSQSLSWMWIVISSTWYWWWRDEINNC